MDALKTCEYEKSEDYDKLLKRLKNRLRNREPIFLVAFFNDGSQITLHKTPINDSAENLINYMHSILLKESSERFYYRCNLKCFGDDDDL